MLLPRLVLKPVYESFKNEQEAAVRKQLALVDGLDAGEGLALYRLAREAKDFDDFYGRVHVESGNTEGRRVAAGKISDVLNGPNALWDDDRDDRPPSE